MWEEGGLCGRRVVVRNGVMRLFIICLIGFWVVKVFSTPLWGPGGEGRGHNTEVITLGSNSLMDRVDRLTRDNKSEKRDQSRMNLSDKNILKEKMESFISKPITERERIYPRWSPWNLNYFNWATQRVDHTMEGGGRLQSYNFLGVTYRLNRNSSLSFRPTFNLSGAGKNSFNGRQEKAEFRMGDTYIQYLNWNLGLLPGDIGLLGKFRIYIPTSESSSRRRNITSFRSWFQFYRPLGRGYELIWHVRPELHFYSQRGAPNRFRSRMLANRQGRIWSYLELAKRVSLKWGLAASAGMEYDFYYDVPSAQIKRRIQERYRFSYTFFMDLGGVWLNLGFLNDIVTAGHFKSEDKRDFQLFRGSETQFSAMTYVRF